MKIKNKIRRLISQQLDVLIPENKWEQYIDLLDRDGKPSRKQLIGIFMILCQQLEVAENLLEDAFFRIELLEGKKPSKNSDDDFKLRNSIDILGELEAQMSPDTKAFYISSSDWKVMEKTVDLELAKTKPEYGYGKEIDPKDGKEKTCLYYKDIPIFRTLK